MICHGSYNFVTRTNSKPSEPQPLVPVASLACSASPLHFSCGKVLTLAHPNSTEHLSLFFLVLYAFPVSMSIGRPDPNALNTVAPDVYHRNLAEIARAKAAIEAFEQMNERGKSNYDRIAEQEERELEEKIQEGLLAK